MTATILTPNDLRSACDAFADSWGSVRIQGAGTATTWAGAADSSDVVIDATALTGIHTYNPADMTVSVGAGTPLVHLQEEATRHGQRISFDAARARRGATVAGLIATADSGPLALGFGSMRDLVIGATVVFPDGTPARTGGHVIKNVAGYDLAKLMHGSYGAYGLMTEVVLRLHPLPEAHRTVALECTLHEAAAHTRSLLGEAQEPVSLEWADGTLLIRIEGTSEGTETRARALAALTGGRVLSDDQAADSWERHAGLVDDATVRIGSRPSRLPAILDRFEAPAAAGLATGVATLSVPSAQVDQVHEAVTEAGGTSVVRGRNGSQARAWGQRPSALRVLQTVKHQLDPTYRLDSGRFGTWLDPAVTSPAAPPVNRQPEGGAVVDGPATTPTDPPLPTAPRTQQSAQAPTDAGGPGPAATTQEEDS